MRFIQRRPVSTAPVPAHPASRAQPATNQPAPSLAAPSLAGWNLAGLAVLPSDDPRETAAERAASQVMRTVPASGRPMTGTAAPASGTPLDAGTRSLFEPRFGWSFAAVRVHADEAAAQATRALGAAAFTVGHDIAFAAGRYQPGSARGRALLAHELAHVVQQSAGPPAIARQTVEQYETGGIAIDRTQLQNLASHGYWDQKLQGYGFVPALDVATDVRLRLDAEERDAVLATVWQMRPQPPAITQDVTRLVTIPKRSPTSRDVAYQIRFEAQLHPGEQKKRVDVAFVAERGGASAVTADPTSTSFTPKTQGGYSFGSFPDNDAAKYWQSHQDEQRRVFNWIENAAPAHFDQVITTSSGSGARAQSASFHVKGDKEPSGNVANLVIVFLGAVAPSRQAAPAGYASHDFADKGVEDAQTTLDPVRQDKLGTINGLERAHAEERAAVKFAIVQYFQSDPAAASDPAKHRRGTRNAEVDAIVPIPDAAGMTTHRRVLYTFRFTPNARDPKIQDVDIQRIGEQGVDAGIDVRLAPRGRLARVNGFADHAKGATEADKVAALTLWLKQRYPGVTPAASATVAELEKDVDAQIRAGSTDPKWYETNYGIKIQTADEARTWLDKGLGYHKPEDLRDLLDFKPDELPLLEFVLERMSDGILSTFRGLRVNRQKVFFDWKNGAFERKERTAGVTRGERPSTRTVTIFDAATDNPDALFAGGLDPSGKPVAEAGSALTFTHELGHVISFRPGVQKAFDKLVIDKHIKPITWYAASDPPNELFPEAFALYYGDPEWLKTNWPDLFDFFDALDKQAPPAAAKPPGRSGGAKR